MPTVNFIDTAKAFFMNNTMFSVGEYFLVTGIIVWLIALVFSALFTRAAISLCWRYRALDEPDGQLKRHENSTPVLGGIPLFFASVLAVAVMACFTDLHRLRGAGGDILWGSLLVASLITLALGIRDDIRGMAPKTKLLFQMIAAMILVGSGLLIHQCDFLGVFQISLKVFAVPATLFWIVGSCNAFNFIDGQDGLACGLGIICSAVIALLGFINGAFEAAILAMALTGSLSAILLFNIQPAKIFLGDSGSQLLGLLLGALSIKAFTVNGVFMLPAAGILLSIPILDALLAILRRYGRLESPAFGDHNHIHHCLQDRGFTPRQSSCILWIAGAVAAFMSFLFFCWKGTAAAVYSLVFVAVELYFGIRLGCLGDGIPLARLFRRNAWKKVAASAVAERTKASLDALWNQMKPLFEQMRLARVVLTLENVSDDGRTDFETYMWARSDEKQAAALMANRWTKRFSLDDNPHQIATLRLESEDQTLRDEQRIDWLLKEIQSNMRSRKKDKSAPEIPLAR